MKKYFVFWTGLILVATLSLWTGCTHLTKQDAPRSVASIKLPEPWDYDPGPDPETKMGKELIDHVASHPFMPDISEQIMGSQLFRPAFGPTLWRMLQAPNSIKILFIGQDGTHIAEAAGRTATAGFGGRAQDMAAYFGVRTGAAFINTYAFTIRGQYAAAGTPIISDYNGETKVGFDTVVDNGTWLLSQDPNSPMVKWRNGLIDWIIRNNKDSLKLIVVFGGSAQDSIGSFIESKGGTVGARYSEEQLKKYKVKVPMFKLVSAGGNNEFPVILTKDGKDAYEKLLKRKVRYNDKNEQKLAQQSLKENLDTILDQLAITGRGAGDSGVMHPAQIGGYELDKIYIEGERTRSLRGLSLSDGSKIKKDILVASFPHPTYLSISQMEKPGSASKLIANSMKDLNPYKDNGWKIEPDPGMENEYDQGKSYRYGRTDIEAAYYDFGTPKNRMVSVSSASRMSRKPNVIVIGTRERSRFDMKAIDKASRAPRPDGISDQEMFTARPRAKDTRDVFDRGPGEYMAKIMKENLDLKLIGKPKSGSSMKQPISQFNIKSHPEDVGDFGHYRGTFKNPKVLILADPDGYDDILTSRALTGTRGQYLHGLMEDLGVNEQYLVIKTVPFGMDGASEDEWSAVLEQTTNYRQKVCAAILKQSEPSLFITDGEYAAKEVSNCLVDHDIPTVQIERDGTENSSGIKEAAAEISKLKIFGRVKASLKMANIPRSHLGYFSRVWEGTGGTHVFNSTSDPGVAFAIVAPMWSYSKSTKVEQSKEEKKDVLKLQNILEVQQVPLPGELWNKYLNRIDIREGAHLAPSFLSQASA